jgi:phospholipase/carboxylesterase
MLAALERPAVVEPEGALVLLHGRGADEHDLFPLLDALDPEQRLQGYTPRAPLALPPGGAHWYAVPRVGYPEPASFASSYALLAEWFDALPFPPERIVLGGFSQGAVMSYALALGAGRPRPAAILAFSGFIPSVEGFDLALADRARLPVSISHGALDPVIDVGFGRDARDRLNAAGLAVRYREDPLGHAISPSALAQAQTVLEEVVPA